MLAPFRTSKYIPECAALPCQITVQIDMPFRKRRPAALALDTQSGSWQKMVRSSTAMAAHADAVSGYGPTPRQVTKLIGSAVTA